MHVVCVVCVVSMCSAIRCFCVDWMFGVLCFVHCLVRNVCVGCVSWLRVVHWVLFVSVCMCLFFVYCVGPFVCAVLLCLFNACQGWD